MVGTSKWEPSNTQKETSPLAHFVRNSLPHKSHRFCSQCEIMEPYTGKQLLLSHIAWLAVLAMQCDTPKAYASHRFSSWRFQHSFLQERYYDIWSQAYLRTHVFWNRLLRSLYACFARYPKCVTHLWCVSATANPIPLLVSL